MKVGDVMTTEVRCTRPDATLHQAAETMRALDVGSLPVCEEDQLVGIVTDRDIIVGSVAEGHDPETDHVSDVMTAEVFYCYADQDVTETARIMKEKQVHRLPVLDRKKRLVGMVSLGDLATSAREDLAEQVLEVISQT